MVEQGYVLVGPNIIGSTGFGADIVRAVYGEWGGRAFMDLLKLITHLETLPYLDHEKAIFVGGSFGGYMCSWLFEHDIIEKFCCATWHDGVFSLPAWNLQGDVIVYDQMFGGPLYYWEDESRVAKFDLARLDLLRNWVCAPPTMISHSDKDYRIHITDGLVVFRVLQRQGVPSRFITFEDEGHLILKEENSVVYNRTLFDWMKSVSMGTSSEGTKLGSQAAQPVRIVI